MDEELKPCPFCGNAADFESVQTSCDDHRWSVGCNDENCIGYQPIVTYARKQDARKAWNTRAAPVDEARIRAEEAEACRLVAKRYGDAYAHLEELDRANGSENTARQTCAIKLVAREIESAIASRIPSSEAERLAARDAVIEAAVKLGSHHQAGGNYVSVPLEGWLKLQRALTRLTGTASGEGGGNSPDATGTKEGGR